MSSVLDLARPELRDLRGYTPGVYSPGAIRLNANESPWRLPADHSERGLNVYPPPRPDRLTDALARHYGVDPAGLLVTRGSSEAIDVLIRAFCRAGLDGIVMCRPSFDMYRLYAGIQGAAVVTVPLSKADAFAVDARAVLDAVGASTKLIFLCTPNNPTGTVIDAGTVETICESVRGRAVVVIDEAYYEFADGGDASALLPRHEHVVLLRTLSKCLSLAGARCGALIARAEIVEFLGKVLPPYTFPTPSIELVLEALSEDSLRVSAERIELIKRERARLAEALSNLPDVRRVYPSQANFVLVETRDAVEFVERAERAGILLRRFTGEPMLDDCVRITVGQPTDNDRLLKALSGVEVDDGA